MQNSQIHEYDEIIDEEFGSRHPSKIIYKFICCVALFWSIFQLWVASPLQFSFASFFHCRILLFNNLEVRSIHLSIAIFLGFLLFPFIKHNKNEIKKIPIYDWVLSIIGALTSLYIYMYYNDIAQRIGIPTYYDIIIALLGITLLFEASRRILGPAIATIALIFLLYSYFGENLPSILAHRDNSISSIVSHQWFSSEGVFGTALGVSADFVFLYVLFGSFLETAGAGNFFIQLSFALLGRFTGGPAKAAVVASGLMGMMSGSSIANTITVGSFTIPLMKKMGLSPEKAGAIEVSAGINGQIMPPVMGAAAFIMAEYLSIPYTEIIKHAFLPAILVYIALLYIVHIEAKKLNLQPIITQSQNNPSILCRLLRGTIVTVSLFIIFSIIYLVIEGVTYFHLPSIKSLFPDSALYPVTLLIILTYVLVLKYQAQFAELQEDKNESILKLPDVSKVLKSGIHFFIPVIILIWSLMIERLSPALSAYWTIIFLMFTLVTQHAIKSFFRKKYQLITPHIKQGLQDCINAMITGARNMVPIAVATATAGIIVGTVSLTGIGLRIGSIVDILANGDLLVALIITGIICIILGMGMPTTACYIIVSTLMVPVLEYATQKNGIFVPAISLHLFVFYFGLMADVTPPVGLASYAAAAISQGNALKTSVQAFLYNMRTMTLPFMFVFNPQLLLYNITSTIDFIILLISSLIGIFTISAATQGYFLIRSKLLESVLLLIIGLSCLYPQGWINLFFKSFIEIPLEKIDTTIDTGKRLKITLIGINIMGDTEEKIVFFHDVPANTIQNKLSVSGIKHTSYDNKKIKIGAVDIGSKSDKSQIDPSYSILKIESSTIQPNSYFIFIPIGVIFTLIILTQKRRLKKLC